MRLVLDEGKSIPKVARDLDLTESSFRGWVERARADRSNGETGLTTAERDELKQLRKQVRELQMERDILKKAATNSARHCNAAIIVAAGVNRPGIPGGSITREDGDMGRPSKHPAEVRERAVRLVFEQTEAHGSQWAAIVEIAPKLGWHA